jgi:hypothetical protein
MRLLLRLVPISVDSSAGRRRARLRRDWRCLLVDLAAPALGGDLRDVHLQVPLRVYTSDNR